MNRYTIYCTKGQTERAYKLGAPIKEHDVQHGVRTCRIIPEHEGSFYANIPTTEQMCGWLRESGISVQAFGFSWEFQLRDKCAWNIHINDAETNFHIEKNWGICDTYEQSIHAAIDAALDYLEKEM